MSSPASLFSRTAILLLYGASLCFGATPSSSQFRAGLGGFLYGPDGDLFALWRTTLVRLANDQGDAWETVKDGLARFAIDPTNGKTMYGVTSERPILVIKSVDKGKTWLTISNGLENRTIFDLAINPANADEVFVATDAGLYRTTDAGFSWLPTALTGYIGRFHINSKAPLNAYALDGNGKIRVSSDGCRTWRDSTSGLPTVLGRGAGRTARTETIKIENLFLVDQNPPYLLASSANAQVFRSTDNGASWQNANKGLETALPGGAVTSSQFYASADEVFAFRIGQIFRSSNGASWSPVILKTNTSQVSGIGGIAKHLTKGGLFLQFEFRNDSFVSVNLENSRSGRVL